MGIVKKVKAAAKSKPAQRGLEIAKGAIAARAAYKAAGKGNVGKADTKQNAAMKGLLGQKGYKAVIKGEKNLIGNKNAKALDRTKRTGVALGSAAYSFSHGDARGAKNNLGQAIKIGVGINNLRVAQHAGQDAIGKKNYNAIHKYGKRALNVGLDVASTAGAIEGGNYLGAANYGSNAVRTAIGAEKLHQGKRALRDKIGQKNYDMLNNSYKAAQLGLAIGKTASDLSKAHDEQKYLKVAMKAKKLYGQANQAHGLFQNIHANAKASSVPVGNSVVTPSTSYTKVAPTPSSGPIGIGGKKPKTSIVAGEPQQIMGQPNVQVPVGRPNIQIPLGRPMGPIGGNSIKPLGIH